MTMCMKFVLIGILSVECGCADRARQALDREIEIAIRVSRGKLLEAENEKLLKQDNPVFRRLASPSVRLIMQLFVELPESQRQILKQKSFSKWRFQDWDESRQNLVQTAIEMQFDDRINVREGDANSFFFARTIATNRAKEEAGQTVPCLPTTERIKLPWK